MSNSYVLDLQMITEIWQENILTKRFEIVRNIYNAYLNKLLKQYKKLKNNSLYRNLLSQEKSKARNSKLNELNKTYCLTEYTLHSYVKYMNQHFKNNIDANTAQKIATRAFKEFKKYRFGKAKKLYFKSYSQLDSVEGKTNTSGIRFKGNKIDIKLKYLVKHLQKVNTYKIKVSQYNHFNNSYKKKSLKNRWNYINNQKIQRDLYSAFLIMNVCTNLKEIDIKAYNETFDNFKKMHDKEILRIKNNKTHISSMGICCGQVFL